MSNIDDANMQNGKTTSDSVHGIRAGALFLLNNKKDGFMWVSRMATMFFTFFYIFSVVVGNPYNYYYKALMANAVTSAIRLHQRIPRFEFSKAFLAQLLLEDSCHYVLFTLIFLYTYPVTLVLLPVFLFAFLHSTSFTVKVLQVCGWSNSSLTVMLSKVIKDCSKGIFRLVAYTEIFLMPFTLFMIFIGKGSLLTPIVYYRFLTLRYQSRRNPYTRSVFYELRLLVEVLASQPAVPERLRQLCHKLVELVSRLAPPLATA